VAFPPQFIAVVTAALVKATADFYINRSCYWSTTFRIGKAIR
jgi:hypothetical protein